MHLDILQFAKEALQSKMFFQTLRCYSIYYPIITSISDFARLLGKLMQ
uniref:Uncharacterized protein n=1 Tax=Nelumbo nucifera TaxID=4432 RepID=A0A822ZBU8_NELNU|nr:TPA_asm: hypothetical protein HUJ06_015272 [Nelumbo nucifera]